MLVFWQAFFGRAVATVFLAVCAALSFGPREWAAMLLGAEPTTLARVVFGLLAVGTAAYLLGPPILRLGLRLRAWRRGFATGPITIAVSEVREKFFAHYAGMVGNGKDPKDAQLLSFGEVTITNTSKTERVVLDLTLKVRSDGFKYDQPATLRSLYGGIYGKDDIVSKQFISGGVEVPQYFINPISLGPQDDIRSNMVFLFHFGDEDIRSRIARVLTLPGLTMTLEVKDHVSGHKAEIPIPGEYRA